MVEELRWDLRRVRDEVARLKREAEEAAAAAEASAKELEDINAK